MLSPSATHFDVSTLKLEVEYTSEISATLPTSRRCDNSEPRRKPEISKRSPLLHKVTRRDLQVMASILHVLHVLCLQMCSGVGFRHFLEGSETQFAPISFTLPASSSLCPHVTARDSLRSVDKLLSLLLAPPPESLSEIKDRDSSVSIETGCTAEENDRFFFSPQRLDRLWGPTSLLCNVYRRLFPWGVKRLGPEADHSPPSRAGAIPSLPHTSLWRDV
jgi:hypothetical protein